MKWAIFLFVTIATCSAANPDYSTGQAARLVIGQPNFDAESDGASAKILGGVGGVAYANNTLFVADGNRVGALPENNRVVIYQNLSSQIPALTTALPFTSLCPACVGSGNIVLGQPNFVTTTPTPCFNTDLTSVEPVCPTTAPTAPAANGLRTPTAVASDGTHLIVADTDNNRVLIWNEIPTSNQQPADVVVGQPNFTSATIPPNSTPTASSLRGPQGVWIQNGALFIADTQNNRVLIYNSIPTSNGASADVVLGQPNFTTYVQINIAEQTTNAAANNMLNPVSVTSDGQHLFVSDLGFNRVLIWNEIPSSNQQPADVEVGQPNMTSSIPDNSYTANSSGVESMVLCASTGVDSNNNPTYPALCNYTLASPRYALSDGTRLYIADGGNDRVLIFETIPSTNGVAADYVIGQNSGCVDETSSGADGMITPLSLAWDGSNLYVADSYNQRVLVYTPAEQDLPYSGVRNAASLDIFAVGTVTLAGTIKAQNTVTITINTTNYTYTVQSGDDFTAVVNGLVALINAGSGDPNVLASPDVTTEVVLLTARTSGSTGNNVALTTSVSSGATITATASGADLAGGGDAASIAPGTLVSIMGTNLSDVTMSADPNANTLPSTLGGVQVYFNGVQSPLLYVSPTQINAQVTFSFTTTSTLNAWVRVQHANGTVTATNAEAVNLVPANPGVFTLPSDLTDPRPGLVMHGSLYGAGTVSVDGEVHAGDMGTITINGRNYTYTVQTSDSLATIRDAFLTLLRQDPQVNATAAGAFTRILLRAKVAGPSGDGIPYSATVTSTSTLQLTATSSALCCASDGGLVTAASPAAPGETILVYATGLGLPMLTPDVAPYVVAGQKYLGPASNTPANSVNATAGGDTANVLLAGLEPGTVGVYQVLLELNANIPSDPLTELTIGQSDIADSMGFVSNIVTFQVVATPRISALTCTPTSLNSSSSSACTITLTQAAPAAGTVVTLSSSDTTQLNVPASITVPSGATTGAFTATTGTVSSSETITITATTPVNNSTASTTISVSP